MIDIRIYWMYDRLTINDNNMAPSSHAGCLLVLSADWQAECLTCFTTTNVKQSVAVQSFLPVLALWVSVCGWLKSNSIHNIHPVALLIQKRIYAHDGYKKNLVIRTARFITTGTLCIEQPNKKKKENVRSISCATDVVFTIVTICSQRQLTKATIGSGLGRLDEFDKLQRLGRRNRWNQTPWPLPLQRRKALIEISI